MNFKNQIAALLIKLGISANGLTALGLLGAFYAGVFIYLGNLFLAGICLTVSGLLDLMDGAVARLSKKDSVFGGILDSSLDRYGDAFVLGGALFLFARLDQPIFMLLALSALIGSFSISYVRARGECELDTCRAGFWERGERITYLAMGLFVNNLPWVIAVLGIATHWTAMQRLLVSLSQEKFLKAFSVTRRNSRYYLKVAALVAAVILFRLN